MVSGRTVLDPVAHFLEGLIIQPGGHWRYGTNVTSDGYAVICASGFRKMYAHRFSYLLHVGPIPDGYDIDHLCRLTWSVCPLRLEAVPHSVNLQRAYRTCQANAHDMSDPANVYTRPNGGRMCKPCVNRRRREYAATKKEK